MSGYVELGASGIIWALAISCMWRRIQKLVKEAHNYPRLRDRILSFYNILLISRKLSWVPFPWRHLRVNVIVRGHPYPFAVRMGTTDWLVLVEIFLDGEYGAVRRLSAGSHPAVIIDLGSNVGFSVRYWLELYPEATVIAVEPDQENCAMIQRNITLCCPENPPLVVQACIVGQSRDSVLFETACGREWAYAITTTASPTARNVRAITIEQIIAEHAITEQIGLLKCDIEGGEAELFAHCDSWIHRVETAVIEVHGRFSADNLMSLLREKGVDLAPQCAAKPDLCIFTQALSQ
jgi:FkbM family methyltransferase